MGYLWQSLNGAPPSAAAVAPDEVKPRGASSLMAKRYELYRLISC